MKSLFDRRRPFAEALSAVLEAERPPANNDSISEESNSSGTTSSPPLPEGKTRRRRFSREQALLGLVRSRGSVSGALRFLGKNDADTSGTTTTYAQIAAAVVLSRLDHATFLNGIR